MVDIRFEEAVDEPLVVDIKFGGLPDGDQAVSVSEGGLSQDKTSEPSAAHSTQILALIVIN